MNGFELYKQIKTIDNKVKVCFLTAGEMYYGVYSGIDHSKLIRGAIIGAAVLYDVKQYENRKELEIDKNKHCADIKKFGFCKYGFMIKNAHRLRSSITYPGKLKFFEVEYR